MKIKFEKSETQETVDSESCAAKKTRQIGESAVTTKKKENQIKLSTTLLYIKITN